MKQTQITAEGVAEARAAERALRPAFSEDQYFELRERLDRMSEGELIRFRAAPENQAIMERFDAFIWNQAQPYLLALVALLAASVTIAALLVLQV